MLQQLCVLADLEGSRFEVSCDLDVTDDIHALTVGKLDFLSIRKLHLKHVSGQLQHNLTEKRYLRRVIPQNLSEQKPNSLHG